MPSSSDQNSQNKHEWKEVSYAKATQKKPSAKGPVNDKNAPPGRAGGTHTTLKLRAKIPVNRSPNTDIFKISPLFCLDSACPDGVTELDICQASIRLTGTNNVIAAQRFGPIWHLYPKTLEDRALLAGRMLMIQGREITLSSKNPSHLVNEYGQPLPAAKIEIEGLPLRLPNELVLEALAQEGIKTRSPVYYDQIQIKKGVPSQWYSGRRHVYIDVPPKTLWPYITISSYKCQMEYFDYGREGERAAARQQLDPTYHGYKGDAARQQPGQPISQPPVPKSHEPNASKSTGELVKSSNNVAHKKAYEVAPEEGEIIDEISSPSKVTANDGELSEPITGDTQKVPLVPSSSLKACPVLPIKDLDPTSALNIEQLLSHLEQSDSTSESVTAPKPSASGGPLLQVDPLEEGEITDNHSDEHGSGIILTSDALIPSKTPSRATAGIFPPPEEGEVRDGADKTSAGSKDEPPLCTEPAIHENLNVNEPSLDRPNSSGEITSSDNFITPRVEKLSNNENAQGASSPNTRETAPSRPSVINEIPPSGPISSNENVSDEPVDKDEEVPPLMLELLFDTPLVESDPPHSPYLNPKGIIARKMGHQFTTPRSKLSSASSPIRSRSRISDKEPSSRTSSESRKRTGDIDSTHSPSRRVRQSDGN